MNTPKTNTTKKAVTIIAGTPAALVMASELTNMRLWWVQAVAVAVVLALMAWWGLLKRTKYDRNGFAIDEARRLPARRIGNPKRVTAQQRVELDKLDVELNEAMKGATA